MAEGAANWQKELERWLEPFLDRLAHPARRRMCPLYVAGLIGPGDRKSVQPMAQRLGMGSHDQLHHFVSAGIWDAAPLEAELMVQADRLVGGPDAYLVIDDTALPKKGTHSVGVAPQYASALGKNANCQPADHHPSRACRRCGRPSLITSCELTRRQPDALTAGGRSCRPQT